MRLDTSIEVEVQVDVYEPSDDSYLLLSNIEVSPGETFLEVGCGSGLIALHAARAGAVVTAADINPNAVQCTRRNAHANGIDIKVVESDLFEKVKGLYDVIAFNPPYLPGETRSTSWVERSWSGGAEGSEVAAVFLSDAWRCLAPGGRIYIVFSSLGGLRSLLTAAKDRYQWELLEEKHLFFESIYAYRLKRKNINSE